jgi:hypothetical protein
MCFQMTRSESAWSEEYRTKALEVSDAEFAKEAV